jgi:hypothetical protein
MFLKIPPPPRALYVIYFLSRETEDLFHTFNGLLVCVLYMAINSEVRTFS